MKYNNGHFNDARSPETLEWKVGSRRYISVALKEHEAHTAGQARNSMVKAQRERPRPPRVSCGRAYS